MKRYWNDLAPGDRLSACGLTISTADILEFAREFDPQPYHLDSKAADESIFGGLCASGWHVLALMMRLLTDAMHAEDIAIEGVSAVEQMRWKVPVFAGDSLSADIEFVSLDASGPRAGTGLASVRVVVHNQTTRPVIELTAELMISQREAA